MKEPQSYDIYKKRHVYAVVDARDNYSLCIESESDHGFTDFYQDGSWVPVAFSDVPVWLQEQIKKSESMEPDDADEA